VLGFLAFKPKALDKASKTAAASTVATANLNSAHEEEVTALKAKSASAAAGVAVVAQVAGTLPDTPARSAIVSETSIVQSKLEAPNPTEQLAAERRANAILTGNLEEARRLNTLAYQDSASMRDRTIAAETGRTKAEAQRDAIDTQLKESAAASLAAQNANNRWKLAVLALALLYIWTKFSHLSYGSLAEIAADVKKGKDALTALDSATTPMQQKLSRLWTAIFHSSS
jgi:predicted DNA-binding protein